MTSDPWNIKQFNDALEDATDRLIATQWVPFYQKIGLDLLRGVVLRTPVGNPDLWQGRPPSGYVGGRARANWQVAINAQTNEEEVDDRDRSPDGSATVSKNIGDVTRGVARSPFGSIHVFNNVPYITRLEEGWSSQAPLGMVAITLQNIQVDLEAGV